MREIGNRGSKPECNERAIMKLDLQIAMLFQSTFHERLWNFVNLNLFEEAVVGGRKFFQQSLNIFQITAD
jgi:hypothetical protein